VFYLTAALAAAAYSPTGWKQAQERRALDEAGVRTPGTVVSHPVSVCTRRVRGCGANTSDLPLGREVDVIYVPDHPEIAEAPVPGTQASRISVRMLLLLWGVTLFIRLLVCRAWAKERSRHAP
jgi:hypothetical protein